MRQPHRLSWFILLLAGLGCSGLLTYGEDRARDLSDVIDIRYGTGFGLGAELQATSYGVGLGCSSEVYYRQWFGRKSVEVYDGLFAHGLLLGYDGDYIRRHGVAYDTHAKGDFTTGSANFLVFGSSLGPERTITGDEQWFQQPGGDPPRLALFRFGGVVFLPMVSGGLYLNVGEIGDFLCGVAGYDMMHDDGIPKFRLPPPETGRLHASR